MPWIRKACVNGSLKGRTVLSSSDSDVEQDDLAQSLSLVKDVIGAVDSKVASYEKKVRLHEIYTKTDSKSIMRMKSGQMFAKEDLKRKKLVRDGSVLLKTAAGRLKGEARACSGPAGPAGPAGTRQKLTPGLSVGGPAVSVHHTGSAVV